MRIEEIRAQLQHRSMTRYQILAVAIAMLVHMADGFDLLAISFAGAAIDREWLLGPERLGQLFSAGLLGMAFGALGLSWLADVYGRRTATLINLTVITIGMTVAAFAASFHELLAARLVTGLGVGAMNAAIGSLVYELSPERRREISLGLVAGAYSLGTIIGGIVSIWLLTIGWRAVFGFGAVLTALLIPVVYFLLPESLDFLLGRHPRNALSRANKELARLGFEPLAELPAKKSNPDSKRGSLVDLVRPPVLIGLVLACLGYFGFSVSQYFILNWMPRLMVAAGYTDAGAISFSVIANIGAIGGCAAVGICTARWGLRTVTVTMLVITAVAIAAFGTLPLEARGLIRTSSFFIGFASFAAAVGMFSIMASRFPPHVRATGIGASFTAGRLGSAAGAYLGGFLLAIGLERPELCMVLALPAIGAAFVISFLARRKSSTSTLVGRPLPAESS